LIERVQDGADFALGSRYVAGGSTDARWSVWRWLNSRAATLLARPFTAACDPMSGFFALRRATFEQVHHRGDLCPLGYKIGLELLVKCRCRRVEEVPIHFAERTRGRSKLTLRQQWLYLRHVARLLRFRMRGK
jgi:dolichol-phosphate mannosyltransferase